ncbi:DoxX family protein [Sphingomicrobium clamense]|uniref:DoxX family protein n=1 Tax=Sphingomicrobium clamense TaxID=2851013 RepID=A0ABS6V776_9SPHN|nr:DoxX family protein [Sphingomicrobium sp. B8]MBW0145427.1 DoxX family protein [Sphingomicrobium sp. B8]
MNSLRDYLSPVARLMLAMVFIVAGLQKVGSYQETVAYMESQGVSGVLLPVVLLVEIGGGLMVAAGWHARTAAGVLALFSLAAGLVFQLMPALEAYDPDLFYGHISHFWKDVAIAGGMAMIVANGPGLFSLESRKASTAPAE